LRKGNIMEDADYCRRQEQECRRLLRLPQSEAEAQVLRNLCNSWVRLANQADLYAEIMRREGAEIASGALAQSPARKRAVASHHSAGLRKRRGIR
jgi:hypothetical protein